MSYPGSIDEKIISAQNPITAQFGHIIPSVVIGNFTVDLIEMHWMISSAYANMHSHKFWEIHVPYAGIGKVVSEDKSAYFKPGNFVLTRPEQVHRWKCIEAPIYSQVWWFTIEKNFVYEENETDALINRFFCASDLVYNIDDFFYSAFDHVIEEIQNASIAKEELLSYLFKGIVMYMAKSLPAAPQNNRRVSRNIKNSNDPRYLLVSRVDEYMQSNLQQQFTLAGIAAHFGLSERTLSRRYLTAKRQSVWKTLSEFRMKRSRSLIENTNLPIEEIARKCGIKDNMYFSKKFKKYFGVSPRQIRLQAKL